MAAMVRLALYSQSRPWPSCARLFLEIRIRLEILVPTLAELQFVRQSPARQLIFEHVNRSFVEDCRNQLNRAASWLFVRTGAAPRRGAASNNRIAARFNQKDRTRISDRICHARRERQRSFPPDNKREERPGR